MSSGLKNKTAKIRRIFERCFMGGENNAVRISENGDVKKRKSSYIKKKGRLLTVLCAETTIYLLFPLPLPLGLPVVGGQHLRQSFWSVSKKVGTGEYKDCNRLMVGGLRLQSTTHSFVKFKCTLDILDLSRCDGFDCVVLSSY